MAATGAATCLVITDPSVWGTGIPDQGRDHIAAAGVAVEVFDQIAVEPIDESIEMAVTLRGSGSGTASWLLAGAPLTCGFFGRADSVLVQDIPDTCLTTCRTDVSGDPGIYRAGR